MDRLDHGVVLRTFQKLTQRTELQEIIDRKLWEQSISISQSCKQSGSLEGMQLYQALACVGMVELFGGPLLAAVSSRLSDVCITETDGSHLTDLFA